MSAEARQLHRKLREKTAEGETVITKETPNVTAVSETPPHPTPWKLCTERKNQDTALRSPNIQVAERGS